MQSKNIESLLNSGRLDLALQQCNSWLDIQFDYKRSLLNELAHNEKTIKQIKHRIVEIEIKKEQ